MDDRSRATQLLPFADGSVREAVVEDEGGHAARLCSQVATIVGSVERCDLIVADPFVSERHVALRLDGGRVLVEDLESKNGTFIEGTRIHRGWTELPAVVRIGNTNLRLCPKTERGSSTLWRRAEAAKVILGRSTAVENLHDAIARLAPLHLPVLVRGETGTGKELVAQLLHQLGTGPKTPFIAINCATISAELAESQLFGHERGAFTGALRQHVGAFSQADGGTLFLDELGELPLPLQAKLLRALETGSFVPVGAATPRFVKTRVVAATHRDLEGMIVAGTFREDLFHRLSVLEIELPPLRNRPEDISLLVRHFAARTERELGRPLRISEQALAAARKHPWPGNVRALRNALLRAGALCDGAIDGNALVPARWTDRAQDSRATDCIIVPKGDFASMKDVLLQRILHESGSMRRAAEVLGVPKSTLSNWLRQGRSRMPPSCG